MKDQPALCVQDAHEIAQVLVQLMATVDEADAQELAIKGTLVQLAGCLKQDFKQFLGPLINSLIADMKRDLDFRVVDANQAELEEDDSGKKLTKMNV